MSEINDNLNAKNIIITGASSGLGKAIAISYAKKTSCRLFLFGRNHSRLDEVSKICKTYPSVKLVNCYNIDVRDKLAMEEALNLISKEYDIDVIIANAGVSAGTVSSDSSDCGLEEIDQINTIIDTNVKGVINSFIPVITMLKKQENKSNIAIISSMASLIGLSSAPSYSSSKAFIRIFGDAMRSKLKRFNVHISVVISGYIDTPMTEKNNFPMPFMINAECAAEKIINGIEKNKRLIVFPKIMYFALKFISILPVIFLDFINSRLPSKSVIDRKTD